MPKFERFWKKLASRRKSAEGAADSPVRAAEGGAGVKDSGKSVASKEEKVEVSTENGKEEEVATEIALPDVGEMEGENDYSRSQLIHVKGWVYEQEKKNTDKIYIFRTPSERSPIKWWKVGGASVLYLVYRVWPMLGRKDEEVNKDADRYYDFREGARSIRDPEQFKKELYRVGIEPIAESDKVIIFQLREKVGAGELKQYRRKTGLYIKQAHETLAEVYKFPELEAHIRDLARTLFQQYEKDPNTVREVFTREYTLRAMRLYGMLREICIGRREIVSGFEAMAVNMDFLGESVYLLAEFGIRGEKQIIAIQRDLVPARMEILEKLEEYRKRGEKK